MRRRILHKRFCFCLRRRLDWLRVAGDHKLSGADALRRDHPVRNWSVQARDPGGIADARCSFQTRTNFHRETETVSPPPPTRSSFMATWHSVTRREGLPAGCVHEQLVRQFCRWVSRPGRWKRDRASRDRIEPGHDLLLSGSRLQCHRTSQLFGNDARYDGAYDWADDPSQRLTVPLPAIQTRRRSRR